MVDAAEVESGELVERLPKVPKKVLKEVFS